MSDKSTLVISRKLGEQLIIGTGPDSVTVTVVEIIRGRGVKLMIQAPRDMPVNRLEVAVEKGLVPPPTRPG